MKFGESAVLPGITRQRVIELAGMEGIEVKLAEIDVNTLLDADEVFLTNSVMQVMPVTRLEQRIVGDDKPGAVTQRLVELMAADVAGLAG